MPSLAEDWLPPSLVPFFSLSHRTTTPAHPDSFPDSLYYNTGPKDVWLIITCMAVMALLRDALRLGLFEPFAQWKLTRDLEAEYSKRAIVNGPATNGSAKANGNGKSNGHAAGPTKKELRHLHRSVLRFAEQGWSAVYYPIQWGFGLYVNYSLPTSIFAPEGLWRDYPHIPLAGPVKIYYLTQCAFYTHQIFIINAEARRKDHWQMMAHHFISVFLMGASYFFNFTRVGCIIMVLMDCSDIFLPIAKMARYINMPELLCNSLFAGFLISWLITRHILFAIVLVSTYTDLPRLVPFEWAPPLGRFLSREYWVVFCACLTALQIIQLFWFGTICRVAWMALTTSAGASDTRSDEEG
ncbi:TLC domain-containing protein [Mycena alexandri]|uniref:TLC domain-containing protein n=1 Tax=Mycena alexandri TaxID=1745969 RepID=A0AAD6XCJ8_9AGAR|nr:TLC domain-containing protein [Mycena alexandri]